MLIDRLRNILEESRHIVFFGGAGVSTESGIPDFRSETGRYRAGQYYGHEPETLLSHDFFVAHPALFYRYLREELLQANARPNDAHQALAHLEEIGRLDAVVTQNIDGLHQQAGSRTVHELHGSLSRFYCVDCGRPYSPAEAVKPKSLPDGDSVPRCKACGGIVRPDVVLYGETLDNVVVGRAVDAIRRADALVVGGSSLAVYPAAGLLQYFGGEHLVVINYSATSFDSKATLVIRESIGRTLAAACLGLAPLGAESSR